MEWVSGTVEEALTNANQTDFMFVIFIYGADELSDRLLGYFKDPTICSKVQQNNIKVFRIHHGTEAFYKVLNKYKTAPIPSIIFIDRLGEPIELITSDIASTKALADKFDHLLSPARPQLFDLSKIPSSSCSSLSPSKKTILETKGSEQHVQNYVYEDVNSNLDEDQDVHDDSPKVSKFQKEFNIKEGQDNHTPLVTLILRFENGHSHSQYFSYRTPFSTVREYVSHMLEHENIKNFYVSTSFPSRVLVPELDKASLEDLGLYPTALINVHFTEVDHMGNVVFRRQKTLLERVGGLTTVVGIALWILFNPIMIGTNWLGLGEFLFALEDGDDNGGFFNNLFSFQEMIEN